MSSITLTIISQIIGWTYFAAWSISFYPQLILNYRLKHVEGLSLNFAVLNFIGFLAYSTYSVWGFIDPTVMPGTVAIQDIAFAVHAFLLVTVTLAQCYYYDRQVWRRVDDSVKLLSLGMLVIIGISVFLQVNGWFPEIGDTNGAMILGYIKVVISFIKYLPQFYRNYKRKSTEGWSIENILLDLTGGLLSFIQIFVDGANTGNWNVFADGGAFNVAKFALSVIAIFFDVGFITQHYILYPARQDHYIPLKASSQ